VDIKIGDKVVCKIKDARLVTTEYECDETRIFEIISSSYQGWHIYVPPYIVLKDTILVSERNAKSLGIDKKFIGWDCIFITSSFVVRVHEILDGMVCCKCNEFYAQSQPNQEDGTLICFSCRLYPIYKSILDDE